MGTKPPDSDAEIEDEYIAPAIIWEEGLENAGVYAACTKQNVDPMSSGCTMVPQAGAS